MTLFEGNLPQNDTERERQREKKKARERASWMPNAMVTAGIGFARSVNVRNSICLVYTKFNGLSCVVPGYRFWGGPIASQCFMHISDKKTLQY